MTLARMGGRDAGLHPLLKSFLAKVDALPFNAMIVRGGTTDEAQALLFAKGRTTKGEPPYTRERPLGRIVTKAPNAAKTAHGPRMLGDTIVFWAVDIAPFVGADILWERLDLFKQLGALGLEHGLGWGGSWTQDMSGDLGHFEAPGWRQAPRPREDTT